MQMMLMFLLLLAAIMVIRATSPYYGALATAWLALLAALLLLDTDIIFPAIILMLIYLGGMLVVFIYSTAYAADLMPLPINLTMSALMASFGVMLITMISSPSIETLCETKPWLVYDMQPSYMLFDIYQRGSSMFIVAVMILTALLFSILEVVSHRQTTLKWFIHSTY
uniref:NADH-ubiquinone oxidoreductase chain 6 n=1 Tax=Branchiostoma floridae TaxID=7739 RepID=C6L3K7_BRAFL|nr:NADH dehydrogenase subunit 6 [Branchiostoma floridae]